MAARGKAFQKHADKIFSKQYTLKSKDDVYTLPCIRSLYSTEPFEVKQLMVLKSELNQTKSLLNDKDIEKWRRHTSKTNPCGLVVKHLREDINPELCTQAWAKFYEIASSYDIIASSCVEKGCFNSLHLCEAPGAFIASLNHYIRSKVENMEWNWRATTLNPFYEGNDTKRMIEGERFILETEDHWSFGATLDGDIMEWRNLEQLQETGLADLITADGSIDCADEPEKQELVISQLLFCEVIAALTLLVPGGSFVVKMFTMFEHNTVCLLYLLCCFFSEVHIFKPGTSKAGNSEVYCVCISFSGRQDFSEELLPRLRPYYTNQLPTKTLFPLDNLPTIFLDTIVDCATIFSKYQQDAITGNIELFEHFSKTKWKFLSGLRQYVAEEYVRRFYVTSLDQSLFLVANTHLSGSELRYWPEVAKDELWHHDSHHTGCYSDRLKEVNLTWQDRVVIPQIGFNSTKSEVDITDYLWHCKEVQWLLCSPPPVQLSDVKDWTIQLGKPITKIESSRFCSSSLIGKLNEARKCAKVLHVSEGCDLLKKLEEQVGELNGQWEEGKVGVSTSNIVQLLENCALLRDQTNVHFVDISGDCRFIHALVDLQSFSMRQCLGLLCENCHTQHLIKSDLKCDVVMTNNCQSYDEEVADHIKTWHGLKSGVSLDVICGSVFTTCSSSEDCDELSVRGSLLNQCLLALKLMKKGDSFVCELPDTLTQFTVGVIYILHELFSEITLYPPIGQLKCFPRQFLVCQAYLASANVAGFIEHLGKVFLALDNRSNEKDVIGILPIIKVFSHKDFYKYIRSHTSNHVKTQLSCIIDLERLLLRK